MCERREEKKEIFEEACPYGIPKLGDVITEEIIRFTPIDSARPIAKRREIRLCLVLGDFHLKLNRSVFLLLNRS